MSARAGQLSPRCSRSSSFYWGRRSPRCHNKTVAAAKPAREMERWGERERERGREQPTPLQLSSSLDKCQFYCPCLPLLSHFGYDLIVSCLATPPSCTRCFDSTHPSTPTSWGLQSICHSSCPSSSSSSHMLLPFLHSHFRKWREQAG